MNSENTEIVKEELPLAVQRVGTFGDAAFPETFGEVMYTNGDRFNTGKEFSSAWSKEEGRWVFVPTSFLRIVNPEKVDNS